MHQRRSAVVALCVLVALVTGACMSATTSRVTAEDSGAVRSNDGLDVQTSGRSALQALRDQPGDQPGVQDPQGPEPAAPADPDDPTPGYDEPQWQLSPQWALNPELLQGTPRFRQLTRKGAPTPGEQPNIVMITTDDQNVNEMRWMPKTRALLGGPGATFSDSISPHPLCCPARAMTLTGQYAQNNGVRSNFWPSGGYYKLDNTNTLPVWLQDAGYETAFMGKYLNEYGLLDPQDVPPGWDHWRSAVDSGVYDYYDYAMNEDGRVTKYTDTYQTEYYADETEDLVAQMSGDDQPFFLWQSHLAPHSACPADYSAQGCWESPTPSMSSDRLFDKVRLPQRRSPAYNEADVSDKPKWIGSRPRLGQGERQHLTELFQRRIESLQPVDDAVARTVSALEEVGELDDTLIIFTSDNGYLLGEHRFSGKIVGYEPSLQVPLMMRGPGVPDGVTVGRDRRHARPRAHDRRRSRRDPRARRRRPQHPADRRRRRTRLGHAAHPGWPPAAEQRRRVDLPGRAHRALHVHGVPANGGAGAVRPPPRPVPAAQRRRRRPLRGRAGRAAAAPDGAAGLRRGRLPAAVRTGRRPAISRAKVTHPTAHSCNGKIGPEIVADAV